MSDQHSSEELIQRIVELEEQNKDLQAEAIKYRTLFDSFPHGITVSDSDGKVLEVNSVSEQLLGISKNDHEKRKIDGQEWRVIRPDGTDMPSEEWASVIALREKRLVSNCEMGIVKNNDETIWLNVTAAPIPLKNHGVVVTYNNITESKQTEDALQESEQSLLSIYNTVGDVIFRLAVEPNDKYRFVSVNNEFSRVTGMETDQITGKFVNEIIPEPSLSIVVSNYKKAIQEKRIVRWEETTDYPTGRLSGEVSIAPIFDEKGECKYLVGSVHDITERKLSEKALVLSEERYRTIIEQAADAVFMHDESGKIVDANEKACQSLGYSREKLLSLSISDIDPEAITARKNEIWDKIINNEHLTIESKQLRRDGSSFPVEVTLGKVGLKTGSAILAIARDITERKRLEASLLQSQKMESIGNLAGGIAHEFNNMLAIIMGNNELIIDELPQGSLARESTEEIRIAGLRARDVVKQLLTFSRQDDAVKKVMDFKIVVQESMKLIRTSTPVNIKIEQSLSADTYPVMCNDTQINQLLINLCNNAVDALPEKGGMITIGLLNETIDKGQTKYQTNLKPGQYAKLMVSGNGIGMDTKILDRVFEPYFTTKKIGEGTGIGMAVVHGIVEKHGGAIAVDSKPGRGTTFTIFLPAHEGLFERETEEQTSLPIGDEHILYVDDEPSIATLGKRLLESLGYTAESTTDPEKALDMVRNDPNKFDLLITDMAMPNMTGDQLVIETLKIRQDMPTIICTGYSAKISEKEAADIGVRSYIMKPIRKSELAKTVRKVLDGAKSAGLVKP
jgi:PAS domain S-box-containing protein